MTDANSSLPVEILEVICEELILEYPRDARYDFLPRWFLLPLLRVCRLWHLVSERFLYRSISLGGSFPEHPRSPEKIFDELFLALEGNSRLVTLVEELRIHREHHALHFKDVRLVTICPNLRHVDLHVLRIDPLEIDSLSKALAEKSVVTFNIVSMENVRNTPFPIYDLMQRWPVIRKIKIDGFDRLSLVERAGSQAPEVNNRCLELRDLIIACHSLRQSDLISLRMMCCVVTVLNIGSISSDTGALDALCGCLLAWSQTLEWLRISFEPMVSSYRPLSEALSSLERLKMLYICNFYVDFDVISSLPHLKRLSQNQGAGEVMNRLAIILEDPTTFTALTHILVSGIRESKSEELRFVCRRRNITLSLYKRY